MVLIGSSQLDPTNYLMGVYVFIEGYAHSDFGRGAAISLLMLLMVYALWNDLNRIGAFKLFGG